MINVMAISRPSSILSAAELSASISRFNENGGRCPKCRGPFDWENPRAHKCHEAVTASLRGAIVSIGDERDRLKRENVALQRLLQIAEGRMKALTEDNGDLRAKKLTASRSHAVRKTELEAAQAIICELKAQLVHANSLKGAVSRGVKWFWQ